MSDHVDRGADPLAALAEVINLAGISGGNTLKVAQAVRDAGWAPIAAVREAARAEARAELAAIRRPTSMYVILHHSRYAVLVHDVHPDSDLDEVQARARELTKMARAGGRSRDVYEVCELVGVNGGVHDG